MHAFHTAELIKITNNIWLKTEILWLISQEHKHSYKPKTKDQRYEGMAVISNMRH